MYFLLMTISQFIPAFDVGYRLTYIAPLGMCTLFYLGKEMWDDCKRRKGDKATNILQYEKMVVIQKEGDTALLEKKGWKTSRASWQTLSVGDLIKIKPGQIIPADVVLLAREDDLDEVFISTA